MSQPQRIATLQVGNKKVAVDLLVLERQRAALHDLLNNNGRASEQGIDFWHLGYGHDLVGLDELLKRIHDYGSKTHAYSVANAPRPYKDKPDGPA